MSVGLYDPLFDDMPKRSDTYCHDCDRTFISEVDHRIDGRHVIVCPYCGHKHCRIVEDGKITSERWDHVNDSYSTIASVWTGPSNIEIKNSKAGKFLREKWLRIGVV